MPSKNLPKRGSTTRNQDEPGTSTSVASHKERILKREVTIAELPVIVDLPICVELGVETTEDPVSEQIREYIAVPSKNLPKRGSTSRNQDEPGTLRSTASHKEQKREYEDLTIDEKLAAQNLISLSESEYELVHQEVQITSDILVSFEDTKQIQAPI